MERDLPRDLPTLRLLTLLSLLLSLTARAQENPDPQPAPPPAPAETAPAAETTPEAKPPQVRKVRPKPPPPPAEPSATPEAKVPPAAPAPAAAPAPVPVKPPPAPKVSEPELVKRYAHVFFAHLLLGDPKSVVGLSALPFQLEGRVVGTPDELLEAWVRTLREKRLDELTLYGIEILTPADMEKKYGKPPGRLGSFPWKAPRSYVSVANISGRAAVAVFKEVPGGGWAAIAFHD
jgi:hypothetical protein